jgi:hypothetical protein
VWFGEERVLAVFYPVGRMTVGLPFASVSLRRFEC